MKSKELRACLAGILVTALAPGPAFAGTNFVQKSLVSGHDGVADNTDPQPGRQLGNLLVTHKALLGFQPHQWAIDEHAGLGMAPPRGMRGDDGLTISFIRCGIVNARPKERFHHCILLLVGLQDQFTGGLAAFEELVRRCRLCHRKLAIDAQL